MNCFREYFCHGKVEENYIQDLKEAKMFEPIMNAVNYINRHAWSILQNKTNNLSEQFNSIITKYICGKRVNFIQRGSFGMRVEAVIIAYNTNEYIRVTHKMLDENKSPGT